jgi:hypothetical protein
MALTTGFTALLAVRDGKRFTARFTARLPAVFLLLRRVADVLAVRLVLRVARIASALSLRLFASAARYSRLLLV